MRKYRILHVLGGLNRGGAETLVMNLYRNIDREKMQFDFIVHSSEYGEYEDEILKLGGKIYRLPNYKVFNHIKYKKAWEKFFEQHKEYKIIHGHVRSTGAIYLKIAKEKGLITIAHSHSISSGNGIKAIIKNILQYKIRYVADYFMACSTKASQWLFGKKITETGKCFILKNGIDMEKFVFNKDIRTDIRNKLHLSEEDILLGHVGRFSKEKNHEFIIKVFSKLNEKNENYKLLLIGNGPEKEKILNKYKIKKVLKSIIFIEPVPNVYDYLNAMDIFIMPSKFEGLGMALIEAQISGLKCIASNNIPKESKVIKDTEFLELNEKKWIEKIENINIKRVNNVSNTYSTQYDIRSVAKRIQQFYLKLGEKNDEDK